MSKQHETIPNEPQEAPVQPEQPEIQQPHDPNTAAVPEEAPQNDPQELPPDITPQREAEPGKTDEAKERATGKGSMQSSVASELKNRE